MLPRFVITFLVRSKHLLISWLQSPSAVTFGAQEDKVCHCFPIYLPWSDGLDAMILLFWMPSFKAAFSLSAFIFIKRLFSSSLLFAIRDLRLLIFLLAILIPACASSSPAFHMMYCAYELISKVIIYNLEVLLSQLWTSQLFLLLLLDLHTGFSGGK